MIRLKSALELEILHSESFFYVAICISGSLLCAWAKLGMGAADSVHMISTQYLRYRLPSI